MYGFLSGLLMIAAWIIGAPSALALVGGIGTFSGDMAGGGFVGCVVAYVLYVIAQAFDKANDNQKYGRFER